MSAVNSSGQAFCRNCGARVTGATELCMTCGARPTAGRTHCQACGADTSPLAEICVKCGARLTDVAASTDVSTKSRLATALLAWFVGEFGVHRFYLGKIWTAVAMAVLGVAGYAIAIVSWWNAPARFSDGFPIDMFLGQLALLPAWAWAMIDFIVAIIGKMKDKTGKLIKNW